MLRIGPSTTAACRCTSTSTSLPCRHASRRSYSRKTPPNAAPPPPPSAASTSYSYTPPVPPSSTKWFDAITPLRSGWRDWPLPTSPHPPPSAPSRPALSEQDTSNLLNTYLTTRGPRSSLGQFSDEYGQLLEIADRQDMPFLKAMVLEDLEFQAMSNGQRSKLGLDRFEKRPTQGGEREETIEVRGLSELVEETQVEARVSETVDPSKRKRRDVVDAGSIQEEEVTPPAEEVDLSQAVAILTELSSPATLANPDDMTAVEQAWTVFSASADLEGSIEDFTLTLSVLLHLASSSSEHLPLALEVFGSLVRVLPDQLVAPQPTDSTSLPSDVSLRFVLLRTLANAALSEDLYLLSAQSLLALRRLDVEHKLADRYVDLDLAIQTIQGGVTELKNERVTSYQPTANLATSSTLDHLAKLAVDLPPSSHSSYPAIRPALDRVVEEAGARNRWDLVAKMFGSRNRPAESEVYELPTHHLKFARWLSGTAPYSTYPSSNRTARPELFSLFARVTHVQLRRSKNAAPLEWTTTERQDYLDLLLTSPGATRETRSLARRLVTHLTTGSRSPSSLPRAPFVLRSSTLLNLIRTSLPPYSPSPSPHLEFLRTQTNLVIQSLVAPTSPYSPSASTSRGGGGGASSGPQLNHFDLTSLAQAYALLGDRDSVGQVYRKLLASKYLPDRKDVELVLGTFGIARTTAGEAAPDTTAVAQGGERVPGPRRRMTGLDTVKEAVKIGVKVGDKVIMGLIKAVLDDEVDRRRRTKTTATIRRGQASVTGVENTDARARERIEEEDGGRAGWKRRIDEILEFARDADQVGLDRATVRRFEDYVLGYVPLVEPARLARLSDARLVAVLSPTTTLSSGGTGRDDSKAIRRTMISPKLAAGIVRKSLETRNHGLAVRIYSLVLDDVASTSASSLDLTGRYVGPLLSDTLETILCALASAPRTTKPRLIDSVKSVLDSTLARLSRVQLRSVFAATAREGATTTTATRKRDEKVVEMVLRSLVKVGEVDAVERFWDEAFSTSRSSSSSSEVEVEVEVEQGMKELVVRWAVGIEGRDRVAARSGVVGEWARQVLRQR
ncbi:hypothetical protein JCM11491_000904 [Sporobolomyces phaffii]